MLVPVFLFNLPTLHPSLGFHSVRAKVGGLDPAEGMLITAMHLRKTGVREITETDRMRDRE